MSYMQGNLKGAVGLSSRSPSPTESMVVHLGRAPPGATGAFRPARTSSSLDSRRALRESRLQPWLINSTMGDPHSSIDNSKVASRRQETRDRLQARKDAQQARSQAPRQSARSQATSRAAPEKASTSQARSQAPRQPARSQATTTAAPEKASTSRVQETMDRIRARRESQQARPQASTQATPERPASARFREAAARIEARRDAKQARPQASTQATPERPASARIWEAATRIEARRDAKKARPQASTQATPAVAPRSRPVGESRTLESLALRERARARLQETKDGVFASRSSRPQAVAKAHHSESKPAVPEVLPKESAKPPSSASSTLPSGGQSSSNTQRGAGAAHSSARLVSRSKAASTSVADSSLPAGVYEKVMREGSHGPAYTLKKVSWKFRNGWENVFSPPDRPVVLDPEPAGAETDTSNVPLFISPAPRYEEIGKTPVHPDCARPRRRPVEPLLPVPPSDPPVRCAERSETRLASAGSVADEGAAEKLPGYTSESRFFHLRHRSGPVPSGVPSHRSAVPRKSSLKTGSSMDNKPGVSFSDRVDQRTVGRWVPKWPGIGGFAV